MKITTISSRTFNHAVSQAKRDALRGPVFITDRGHPAHVLLTIEHYQKITEKRKSGITFTKVEKSSLAHLDLLLKKAI